MNRPPQAVSLSAATAQMKTMAGKYGKYPWSFSTAQDAYLRAISPMPDDLAAALQAYDAAMANWRTVEQAMIAARPAPAGGENEVK